ncbi:MAG: TSUP family transporter [Pseudomonadota bacterium]
MEISGTYLILAFAALFAGLIDAVVGGGGLIQVPALFSALPSTAPATLLGTSKLAGVWGTAVSAVSYARRVRMEWSTIVPATITAFAAAFVGAYTVTKIPPDYLRQLLPLILIAVAVYTFIKKDFGANHTPTYSGAKERGLAILAGAAIGFYDGFFGPGTGSFLVFIFVRFFGFNFLGASAAAKIVNVACNVAALMWFGYSGNLLWQLGLMMAVCNIVGSLIGTSVAIRFGSAFVRKAFLCVVSGLIIKTFYDGYLK